MATYVLIPGAGGSAHYWDRVAPLLRERGHDVVAVELPGADEAAGLPEYADEVLAAIGLRTNLVVVAQSLGGFTAPIVCERVHVDLLVLLNAMVPTPGETAGDWWAATGQAEARARYAIQQGRDPHADVDVVQDFFHDVPADVTAEIMAHGPAPEAAIIFGQPWPLERWPDVPTRFLQGRDDRLFPLEFQRRVVRQRLGIELDAMPGGHLLALSQPAELAQRLEAYRTAAAATSPRATLPGMTEVERLADELQAAIDGINAELAQISADRWSNTITAAEGWSVGHAAHHIGEGYQQSLSWIEQAGRTGQPVVFDPATSLPLIHAANARCLDEHGAESRSDTLTLLRDVGHQLVERVRSLTDEQMEAPMMIVMGEARPGRVVALPMALRHANTHLESIRQALGSA